MIFLLLFCYTAVLGLELLRLKLPRVRAALPLCLTLLGLVLHTVCLFHYHKTGAAMYAFVSAWGLVAVHLALTFSHHKTPSAVILLPLTLLFIVIGYSSIPSGNPSSAIRHPFLIHIHIALILAATVSLCTAFFAAVMFLLQDVHLRHKKLPLKLPLKNLNLPTLEWSLGVCRWSLGLALILFLGGFLAGFHLAAIKFLWDLPPDDGTIFSLSPGFMLLGWLQDDPLVFGAIFVWCVLIFILFSPKNNGRRIALSAVFVFLCFLAVLLFALNTAHWQRNKILTTENTEFTEKYL
jgi:hypothetical protein